MAASDTRHQCRTTDRASAGAGIERDQDKPGEMLTRKWAGSATTVALAGTPCGPDQIGGFASREPSVPRFRRVRQYRAEHDIRTPDFIAEGVIDRGCQILKLTTGSG